jgi:Cu/Ag efflux protein CusF
MKKLTLVITLLLMVGFVTFVCTQTLTRAATPAAPAKKVASRIVGEVVSVDTTANTITVKDKSGKSETLTLDPKIVVKKAIALTDISAGNKVSVRYKTVAGKKIARWIHVFTSAKKESTPTK